MAKLAGLPGDTKEEAFCFLALASQNLSCFKIRADLRKEVTAEFKKVDVNLLNKELTVMFRN